MCRRPAAALHHAVHTGDFPARRILHGFTMSEGRIEISSKAGMHDPAFRFGGAGLIAVRLRCRYLLSQILGLVQRSWSPVLAAWIYDDTHEAAIMLP